MTNIVTKKMLFSFTKSETEKSIVYHLVKDYSLEINIFRAKVTPEEEGYLVLEVTGSEENIKKAMQYVASFNVTINEAEKGVHWARELCTSCGNCLTHCPTAALHISDRKSMTVEFSSDKCIECLNCLKNCPYNACTSIF